jgi:hypothetical protein
MRREDRQALLPGRDDDSEQPCDASVRPRGSERRLVAVMAVRDQELRARELLDQRVGELGVEQPEP